MHAPIKTWLVCMLAIHGYLGGASLCAQDWLRPTYWNLQPEAERPGEGVSPLDVFGGIEPPATFAPSPAAPSSLLLERLDEIAAPSRSAFLVEEQPPAIETAQLTSTARIPTTSSRSRRSPVAMQPTIRGYQQQSVLAQYQGAQFVPVRYDLDSLITSIDPGVIESVVLIPGPYGVKYGPGLAFLDIVATPLPRSDGFDSRADTSLLYRSNGAQFYGRETVTVSGLDYGVRAAYGQKVGSDYFSGDGTRIPASYNVKDLNVVASYDLTPELELQFEYLLQNMSDTEFAGLAFDASERQTDAFFARLTREGWEGLLETTAEGWYNRTFLDGDNLSDSKQFFNQSNAVFFPPGTFLGFTDADITSSGWRLGSKIGDADTGQLTIGMDARYLAGELNEFDDFDGSGFFDSFPIPEANQFDVGSYIELSVPLADQSQVTFGGRVDWVRTERPAVFSSFDPDGVEHLFDFGADFIENDTLLHGFVTVEQVLSQEWRLRAGFGHGQRAPNLTERFALDPFLSLVQNPTSAVIGDEFLNQERASQFDLALRGDYEVARVELTVFWSYIDEHITLAPALGLPPDPDLRLLDFVNQDSVLTGTELLAELNLLPSLLGVARVSYVEGRNLVEQQPLPNIFPLQGSFSLVWYEPVEDRRGVEFTAWVVDDQDRLATSLLERPTPGFSKYDLRAYWQATDAMRVTVGFENIGDRNYLEHLSVHNPLVLEPGFNFYSAVFISL